MAEGVAAVAVVGCLVLGGYALRIKDELEAARSTITDLRRDVDSLSIIDCASRNKQRSSQQPLTLVQCQTLQAIARVSMQRPGGNRN